LDLINQLVSSLEVSEPQAKGGAGLLFKLAQEQLSGSEFAQVRNQLSGVGDMMAAAPSTEAGGGGLMGGVGTLLGSLGGSAGKLGALASLAGGFDKLGLDADMISKFIPVILQYARSEGGEGVAKMLAGAIANR